jgi:RNA polymerase sigma-70 factor, ECF subfamily
MDTAGNGSVSITVLHLGMTRHDPATRHYTFLPDPVPSREVKQDACDSGTLDEVYRAHAARLWRALMAYAGSRDVADDALAEAFAQAAARGEALRAPERWVWVTAFRIAAGLLKAATPPATAQEPTSPVGTSEALELLEALAHLPPRQRAALVLHYYGGYTTREIAQIVGSSAATVRVHLSAGRRRLRTLLEVDDD